MTLIHVADASRPFDYHAYQQNESNPKLTAVAGYAGGDTPHVWTGAEIDAAERAGYRWWPIWTAPNSDGRPLTSGDGAAAAAGMAARLDQLRYNPAGPVFLDIERSIYDASPNGAAQCWHVFADGLRARLRRNVHLYCAVIGDWLPDWTGQAPIKLLDGAVGVQYANFPDYDLSVFDATVEGNPPPPPPVKAAGTVRPYLCVSGGSTWVIAADLSHKAWLFDEGDVAALKATGMYDTIELSAATLGRIPG